MMGRGRWAESIGTFECGVNDFLVEQPPPGFRPGQFYDVAQIIHGEIGARYLSEEGRAAPVTCSASDMQAVADAPK